MKFCFFFEYSILHTKLKNIGHHLRDNSSKWVALSSKVNFVVAKDFWPSLFGQGHISEAKASLLQGQGQALPSLVQPGRPSIILVSWAGVSKWLSYTVVWYYRNQLIFVWLINYYYFSVWQLEVSSFSILQMLMLWNALSNFCTMLKISALVCLCVWLSRVSVSAINIRSVLLSRWHVVMAEINWIRSQINEINK